MDQPTAPPSLQATARGSLVRRSEPRPSRIFDTYWRFAVERQAIFLRRVRGEAAPWTDDPVLKTYKFTNAYRAADRVSQYLIQNILYRDEFGLRDTVLRVLLFKLFNRIETWQLLESLTGRVDVNNFQVEAYDKVLSAAMEAGASIYSAAYIMPSGPTAIRRPRKHRMHLELLARLLRDRFPEKLAATRSMQAAYEMLCSLPGFGPFLAYQFITDLNYSIHFQFSEMEFVVPGPGARDGIRKCFASLGDYSESDTICWLAERQGKEFAARGLAFESLWGRPLQLIDCQNLLCEVDKYARVAHPDVTGYSGRTQIKQKFSPTASLPRPWFPPKWSINDRVKSLSQPTTGPSLL